MNGTWKVIETRPALKALRKLPKKIQKIYGELLQDLQIEGPKPLGWNCADLHGIPGIRIRLNREYRVIIEVSQPNIIVVRIAHRKEVYE